jgi:hypothetical protein
MAAPARKTSGATENSVMIEVSGQAPGWGCRFVLALDYGVLPLAAAGADEEIR